MKTFEFINKLANVRRWSHAYCHKEESVLEHTAVVAIISLSIGQQLGADMDILLKRALLHDMEEVVTGDIPNPTKYHSPNITKAIKDFENVAAREVSTKYFGDWAYEIWYSSKDNSLEGQIVRLADIAAVVYKIRQEVDLGNNLFSEFEENVWNALFKMKTECDHRLVQIIHDFMDTLMGADNEQT